MKSQFKDTIINKKNTFVADDSPIQAGEILSSVAQNRAPENIKTDVVKDEIFNAVNNKELMTNYVFRAISTGVAGEGTLNLQGQLVTTVGGTNWTKRLNITGCTSNITMGDPDFQIAQVGSLNTSSVGILKILDTHDPITAHVIYFKHAATSPEVNMYHGDQTVIVFVMDNTVAVGSPTITYESPITIGTVDYHTKIRVVCNASTQLSTLIGSLNTTAEIEMECTHPLDVISSYLISVESVVTLNPATYGAFIASANTFFGTSGPLNVLTTVVEACGAFDIDGRDNFINTGVYGFVNTDYELNTQVTWTTLSDQNFIGIPFSFSKLTALPPNIALPAAGFDVFSSECKFMLGMDNASLIPGHNFTPFFTVTPGAIIFSNGTTFTVQELITMAGTSPTGLVNFALTPGYYNALTQKASEELFDLASFTSLKLYDYYISLMGFTPELNLNTLDAVARISEGLLYRKYNTIEKSTGYNRIVDTFGGRALIVDSETDIGTSTEQGLVYNTLHAAMIDARPGDSIYVTARSTVDFDYSIFAAELSGARAGVDVGEINIISYFRDASGVNVPPLTTINCKYSLSTVDTDTFIFGYSPTIVSTKNSKIKLHGNFRFKFDITDFGALGHKLSTDKKVIFYNIDNVTESSNLSCYFYQTTPPVSPDYQLLDSLSFINCNLQNLQMMTYGVDASLHILSIENLNLTNCTLPYGIIGVSNPLAVLTDGTLTYGKFTITDSDYNFKQDAGEPVLSLNTSYVPCREVYITELENRAVNLNQQMYSRPTSAAVGSGGTNYDSFITVNGCRNSEINLITAYTEAPAATNLTNYFNKSYFPTPPSSAPYYWELATSWIKLGYVSDSKIKINFNVVDNSYFNRSYFTGLDTAGTVPLTDFGLLKCFGSFTNNDITLVPDGCFLTAATYSATLQSNYIFKQNKTYTTSIIELFPQKLVDQAAILTAYDTTGEWLFRDNNFKVDFGTGNIIPIDYGKMYWAFGIPGALVLNFTVLTDNSVPPEETNSGFVYYGGPNTNVKLMGDISVGCNSSLYSGVVLPIISTGDRCEKLRFVLSSSIFAPTEFPPLSAYSGLQSAYDPIISPVVPVEGGHYYGQYPVHTPYSTTDIINRLSFANNIVIDTLVCDTQLLLDASNWHYLPVIIPIRAMGTGGTARIKVNFVNGIDGTPCYIVPIANGMDIKFHVNYETPPFTSSPVSGIPSNLRVPNTPDYTPPYAGPVPDPEPIFGFDAVPLSWRDYTTGRVIYNRRYFLFDFDPADDFHSIVCNATATPNYTGAQFIAWETPYPGRTFTNVSLVWTDSILRAYDSAPWVYTQPIAGPHYYTQKLILYFWWVSESILTYSQSYYSNVVKTDGAMINWSTGGIFAPFFLITEGYGDYSTSIAYKSDPSAAAMGAAIMPRYTDYTFASLAAASIGDMELTTIFIPPAPKSRTISNLISPV